MLKGLLTGLFGSRHVRERKRVQPIVDEINELGARVRGLSDEALQGQTAKFRAVLADRTGALQAQIAERKARKHDIRDAAERESIDREVQGADGRGGLEGDLRTVTGQVLDELLPEAFATVREAARRLVGQSVQVTGQPMAWDMVHYDVQLIGGIQLHLGRIAEMATGEGKTLVATLPLYLNALPGRGAHLVTVNSYLARRDSQWMGFLFTWLGLSVGCLDDSEPGTPQRRAAYLNDITYGTNNEYGFDYLRDNMVTALEQRVQRGHAYAIVDEVDSVLVDEARTPLIISGPVGNDNDTQYAEHNGSVVKLVRRQNELVNQLVGEGARALAAGNEDAAALALYKARLGGPKNKRLLKVMQEPKVQQFVLKMELEHIADRKQPHGRQVFGETEEDLLFVLDEKGQTVHLTDRGVDMLSPDDHEAFVLPDLSQAVHALDKDADLTPEERIRARRTLDGDYAMKSERLNIVHQLLRAHTLFEQDVNYVIQEGQVLIVDEFTGRTMPGRRWSEGLHQAVEAKEGVQVKGETQTLATITIQNYFRMYDKLGGMTGTAETEETEFFQIYGLEVSVIPTNRDIVRDDRHDLVYKTRREKLNAIVDETRRLHGLGFPVLVGTTSVDESETISKLFQRGGLPHNVLNAKYHQREAEIVSLAGQPGAVTIATNMAGRGTDIKLGPGVTIAKPSVVKDIDGNDVDIEECGGLHIVGSERHESRRIDRQLRGRSGRQGDPGASQFFLSLEDDLMRLFGSDRIARLMDRMGAKEGEVLTHPLITRSIEQAQKRVELQHFQSRKRLLEYDDVMNQQREVIYSLRAFALEGGEELRGEALGMVEKAVVRRVDVALALAEDAATWDLELLQQELLMQYMLPVPAFVHDSERPTTLVEATTAARTAGRETFLAKVEQLNALKDDNGNGYGARLLSFVMLQVLDEKWKDHLYDLDQLRAAIHYRSWGQKDPLLEYKQEAYGMFVDLVHDVHHTFTERFLKAQLMFDDPSSAGPSGAAGPASGQERRGPPHASTKRYDAFGVLEDAPADELAAVGSALDVGPAESPSEADAAVRPEPTVIGAGRARSLTAPPPAAVMRGAPLANEWADVGRNDPCPCGSGKKFKKCHGANL